MRGIGSADASDASDASDAADASDIGVLIGTDTAIRPIGVSPALEQVEDGAGKKQDWWRGYKWPPVIEGAKPWGNAAPTKFPRQFWTGTHYSITVLAEFVRAKAGGLEWDSMEIRDDLQDILDDVDVQEELKELVALVEYRSGVMSEGMAQRGNVWAYWRGILMCDTASAPYTYDLFDVSQRVGQFQAMHYKRHFNRARPSQYSPSLLPPIDPPGHASFPSGHATESYLTALCLAQVMPHAAKAPAMKPVPGQPDQEIPNSSPLQQMAQRIARNREVLGVHFPSDSAAGKFLAEKSFAILMECPTMKDPTNGLIARAKKEWWP